MNDTPICPCGAFEHPKTIANPSGRDNIAYRSGDYTTFRHALLLSRPGETELANWRPGGQGDLALQMVEWWAYLADILTFYNERIANQSYLRTADLPESVQRLIRLLGYRPRPGIGATGVLAALLNGAAPFTLPQGLQLQSKPGPGKQPQLFELNADTPVQLPDAVAAEAAPNSALFDNNSSVLVKGVITGLKQDDPLLLLEKKWQGQNKNYALVTVKELTPEKDLRGRTNTRIKFNESLAALASARAKDYRLLKSAQSAHVWQYPTNHVIQSQQVDLEAITRGIKVGDPVLFEIPDSPSPKQLVSITGYTEDVWYANAPDPANPQKPPSPDTKIPPIPIPHTRISFHALTGISDSLTERASVQVHYAWQDAGQLLETPATAFSTASATLHAVPPALFPPDNHPVLLEDANGAGVPATAIVNADGQSLSLIDLPEPAVTLTPPLRVLFNLLSVSRGKIVVNEILGSGDASVAGQEFVLQQSPLTYLPGGAPTAGDSYHSTLRIGVDGIEWQEVASFYNQAPDARVFVTREDENNKTHVLFGDGVNGARLPSGGNNVSASYRYGSGADAPAAGTLTIIQQPQPGLKAIRNPVPVGGGADPDPPQKIRRYAPQSVLTFGRAVSADDYETIAVQTPGVARAKSYWTFDPDEQRTLVALYVGDDANAVNAAKRALARAGDPNRPARIRQAAVIPTRLNLTLRIDPSYTPAAIATAVTEALADPDSGLLGIGVMRIGQVIFQSQLLAACLRLPGVLAVHGLQLQANREEEAGFTVETGPRYDPGQGGFFQLQPKDLTLTREIAADGR